MDIFKEGNDYRSSTFYINIFMRNAFNTKSNRLAVLMFEINSVVVGVLRKANG